MNSELTNSFAGDRDRADAIWYFEEVDLFEIICPHKYKEFADQHSLLRYNKSDFVFMQDEPARNIYLVAEGKVKIGYYDDRGREFIKTILKKGEIFGEMALLGGQRQRNFAEVIENGSLICKLDLETTRQLTREYRGFQFEIEKRIGDRMRKMERRLEILFFKDIRTRLVEFLKDLAAEEGEVTDAGILIRHNYTQEEIAKLIGTSRKSVSLLLGDLEQEQLLSTFKGAILIPDPERLQ